MSELTGANTNEARSYITDPECLEDQKAVVSMVQRFLDSVPKIQSDIEENQNEIRKTQKQIIAIDKKHTEAIARLEKSTNDKLDDVVDMNNHQTIVLSSIQTTIDEIKPFIEYAAPVSRAWHRWRPRIMWFGAASMAWVVISFFDPSVSPAALRLFIKALMG